MNKWTNMADNERPIIFTITPDVTGRCEVHTVDKRAIEPRYFCNNNEVIECMAVLTERYNDKGYAVLFEVD